MSNDKEIRSVEIFRGAVYQAQMVKNLLENAGIESWLLDEISGTLNLPWDNTGGVGTVKVTVSSANYDEALAVVQEYKKNIEEGPGKRTGG